MKPIRILTLLAALVAAIVGQSTIVFAGPPPDDPGATQPADPGVGQ